MEIGEGGVPAIGKLGSYILEISVAHIVHTEDVDEGIFRNAFADVGVEPQRQLLAFLRSLGEVHDLGTFGFRHDSACIPPGDGLFFCGCESC